MNPQSKEGRDTIAMHDLFRKLLLKPSARAALLFAPSDYPRTPADLPEGVQLVDQQGIAGEPAHTFDFVHLFVSSTTELAQRAPLALTAVKPGGLLWISYPKKSGKIKTDIHRDVGWDVVKAAGMEGVALISVDQTWSAMRFRPVDRAGR